MTRCDLRGTLYNLYTRNVSGRGINENVSVYLTKALEHWDAPGRFYHTVENHLIPLVEKITGWPSDNLLYQDSLLFAALYHDVLMNEDQALVYFLYDAKRLGMDEEMVAAVSEMILDTKTTKNTHFNRLDWDIFYQPWATLVAYEHQIFREYQKHDYKTYKEKRVEFLTEALRAPCFPKDDIGGTTRNVRQLIEYVKARQPKIGLYAGSFSPFTIGHLDILRKAEKVFDKVIVYTGVNTDKQTRELVKADTDRLRVALGYRQVSFFTCTMPQLLNDLGYPVTLVRGLRDGKDLEYEINYLRVLEDMTGAPVDVAYFPCDRQYSHVSSSMVRGLQKMGCDSWKKFVPGAV
jgi:pantetheine-phosphate adenylyltransferase